MRMIEAVAARLYQPVKMAANLGIELPSSNLVSENQIHNASGAASAAATARNAANGSCWDAWRPRILQESRILSRMRP